MQGSCLGVRGFEANGLLLASYVKLHKPYAPEKTLIAQGSLWCRVEVLVRGDLSHHVNSRH